MSEQVFDPVAQMGHDGAEIERLRARVAELEKAIGTGPGSLAGWLKNGVFGEMDSMKRRVAALETELERLRAVLEKR